ncbi:MAG: hypothetical protein ACYDH3_01800 [Candidatus Aminicenantales bacterium]
MAAKYETRTVARVLLFGPLIAAALFSGGCRAPKPSVGPPSEIREIEGYASLRLTRSGETSRSKFAFAVALPRSARIEIFDALGRSVSIFLVRGDEAYLVLPSERAYWRSDRDDVIAKFLGFPIRPAEIAGLLSGRWSPAAAEGWTLDRDNGGRIVSGTRGDLSFRVLEFFPGNQMPRRWSFQGSGTEGVVSLLEAAFDRPGPDFSPNFLRSFAAKSWPEIERLLR